MSGLSLRHLRKVYPGGGVAVADFQLEIAPREFVVLVGPSGCGKTTTLRMIAGLEKITSGELYIGDRLVNNVPPKDRDIAMVFQNYALYPHMSVFENLAFGLRLRKVPKPELRERVARTAASLELEQLLDRKPGTLSGGQRQRVAMGRAMVRNPSVFLLDEPLSNLDAALREQIRGELLRLHRSLEATFVYVTHDQTEAMTLGSVIVVMRDGFIQQADTPQVLYKNPKNMFVAGFIGTPRMNFIDALFTAQEDGPHLSFGGHSLPLPPEQGERLVCAGYSDREIVLGIRPEHIRFLPDGSTGDGIIHASVETAELLGSDTLVHIACEGASFVARADSDTAPSSGHIAVAFDASRLHLFDAQTHNAIV